jgi:hypothetical protein
MAAKPAPTTLPTANIEAPVFSGAARRGRWLRRAGLGVAALVVLWLIALIAGVLGFDSVPGLSLPALEGRPSAVFHRDAETVPAVPRLRASIAGSSHAVGVAGRRSSPTSPAVRRPVEPQSVRRQAAPGRRSPSTPSRGAAPVSAAAPVVKAPAGRSLGASGAPPAQSNSHRADAPGQQLAPTDPGPRSPRALGNR